MARQFFNIVYSLVALGGLAYGVTSYFGLDAANEVIGNGFLVTSKLLPAVAILIALYFGRLLLLVLAALVAGLGVFQAFQQGGFDPLPKVWVQIVELAHQVADQAVNYWSWVTTFS